MRKENIWIMVTERRDFLKIMAMGCAAFAAAAISGAGLLTKRVTRAVRARCWPGRIKNLRRDEAERPGHWAG